MSNTEPNPKLLLIPRVLLFLFAIAVTSPIRYWAASSDVDNTWLYGLNFASAHGLVPGRDVLSTTGPLAYLAAPMDVGQNLAKGLLFQCAIWIVLLAILIDLYFRARLPLRNLALATALLTLASPLFWFNRVGLDNLLLAAAFICIVMYRWQSGTLRLLTALVFMGIMPLIKFTSAFIASGAMAGFLIERALSCRRSGEWRKFTREAILIVIVPTVVAGACLLATVPVNAFGAFLKSAAEMSSGYSVSMSFPGTPVQLWAALLSILLIAGWLFVNAGTGRVPSLFLALLLAAPVAVSLKHGFVRQDVHVVNFFCFCALAMALVALSARLHGGRAVAVAILLLPFLLIWVAFVATWERPETVTGWRAVRLAWGARNPAALPRDLLQQAERESQPALRIEPELQEIIGTTPTGFLSPSYVLTLVLDHVQPAIYPPIFPGDAYTPYLDEVSARWIREKGPHFLLTDATTIDMRNIWAEIPATWDEVYRWYDTRRLGSWNLLLERRTTPRFQRMNSIGTATVSLRAGFAFPDVEGPLFWTMRCQMSPAGKVNKLLLRVPALMAEADFGSKRYRFRILPDQLSHPALASLPVKPSDLAEIFNAAGNNRPSAKRLAFGTVGFQKYWQPDAAFPSWEPTCDVEFLQPQ